MIVAKQLAANSILSIIEMKNKERHQDHRKATVEKNDMTERQQDHRKTTVEKDKKKNKSPNWGEQENQSPMRKLNNLYQEGHLEKPKYQL